MPPTSPPTNGNNWLRRSAERGPVMVVAAHPDDETLAVGGQIRDWPDVYIVHVTNGAPHLARDHSSYADIRRGELREALKLAGIPLERAIQLGAVDQETPHSLLRLSLTLHRLLLSIHPGVVLCHPYEGGHPDHDSAAFIVQAAVNLAELSPAPLLAEYTSYHNAPPFQSTELRTGHFLPGSDGELEIALTAEQQDAKRRMVDCFASQQEMMAHFTLSPERFRLTPTYDFTRPPHEGFLYYDQQGWGVHSSEWRVLASKAQLEIGRCTCPFAPPPSIW